MPLIQQNNSLAKNESIKQLVRYEAHVLLLVSGHSVEEMQAHRASLEHNYQNAIQEGILSLVNAPLADYYYPHKLKTLRCTHCPKDNYERRYWRSQQNLDIAFMLDAVTSTMDTEFIMLLEDDTAFQPGFGRALRNILQQSQQPPPAAVNHSQGGSNSSRAANETTVTLPVEVVVPSQRPKWGRLHFGFGYSGIVLHASDAKAYQQVHYHFFDELPCDIFRIYELLGNGNQTYHQSRTSFANGKRMFLKHLGRFSTLSDKIQKTW